MVTELTELTLATLCMCYPWATLWPSNSGSTAIIKLNRTIKSVYGTSRGCLRRSEANLNANAQWQLLTYLEENLERIPKEFGKLQHNSIEATTKLSNRMSSHYGP